MKKRTKVICFSLLLCIVCFFVTALFFAGYWLQRDEKPIKSDAIIVLAGTPTRSFYAADLYRQGYAPQVYISRPMRDRSLEMLDKIGVSFPRQEEVDKEVLLKKGVHEHNIHFFGQSSLSTIQEAEAANKLFRGDSCKIIIVTSPYHVRRANMIFKDTMKNCQFSVLGTTYEPFPKKWWTDQDAARNVLLETSKTVFYLFGGRFRSRAQ
ncbi:MAG: YdcF family protein [Syntrophus sp. (in: bacteria)]